MPAALGSTSAAESTSCAAPSAGVFVVAPQKSPTAIAGGIPTSHARPVVTTAPRTTTVAASAFSSNPCRRMEATNPGPICIPIVKTKRMRPSSFTKCERCGSIRTPSRPSAMPTKSAPALPRPTPRTRSLPSPRPSADTSERTNTALGTVSPRRRYARSVRRSGLALHLHLDAAAPQRELDAPGGGGQVYHDPVLVLHLGHAAASRDRRAGSHSG